LQNEFAKNFNDHLEQSKQHFGDDFHEVVLERSLLSAVCPCRLSTAVDVGRSLDPLG
jgi:hypothetical protein